MTNPVTARFSISAPRGITLAAGCHQKGGWSREETESTDARSIPPGKTGQYAYEGRTNDNSRGGRRGPSRAAYLTSGDRYAELTIAKLIGILDRRDVVKAGRFLRISHGATAVAEAALAKASGSS